MLHRAWRHGLLALAALPLVAAPAWAVPWNVYYRANVSSPWTLYATEPDRPTAAAAVADLQAAGFLAEMLSDGVAPAAVAGVTTGPSYSWYGGGGSSYRWNNVHHDWSHYGWNHHYAYDHTHTYNHFRNHVGVHPTHHPLQHHFNHAAEHRGAARRAGHRAHHAAHHAAHHSHAHAHGHSGHRR